jgi:hypothetical protein
LTTFDDRNWQFFLYHQPFWHVSPGILPYLAGSSNLNAILATTSNSMTFCQMPSRRLSTGLLLQRCAHLSCTQLPCWLIPLALATPRWTPVFKKKRGQEANAHETRSPKKKNLRCADTWHWRWQLGIWSALAAEELLLCQAAACCGCRALHCSLAADA